MKYRIVLIITLALALLVPFAPRASAQTIVACEQVYTVTASDLPLSIAYKFYGNLSAFDAIFLATNLKAQTDTSFVTLARHDAAKEGTKLCIPSKADAEQLMKTLVAATPPATVPTTTAGSATPTAVSATSSSATNTPAPVRTLSTGLRPEDVTFNAYGLGQVQGRVVSASPYNNSSPPAPVGAPAHVAFQFNGEDRLWVIPAAAYQAQWDAAGNNTISRAISQLRLLLRDKPTVQNPPLPFLPSLLATNDLVARIRYLDFNGGSGIAYVGRIAQDASPVLASQIYYSFFGLTNDGKYIVSFRYPALTSRLPKTVGDLTPEHLAEIEANPRAYLQETMDILNGLSNSAFGPDLSRLDALAFSISVPSVGSALPPPVGSSVATPSANGPTNNGGGSAPSNIPANNNAANKQRLLATDWKWVSTISATSTLTVDDPEKYSLRFNNANGFGITADCNFGAGNFNVTGNVLNIIDLQAPKGFAV